MCKKVRVDVLVQMSRSREAELRQEVALLQQEKQELQHNTSLLELDIQTLRDEIQKLTGETICEGFPNPGGNRRLR